MYRDMISCRAYSMCINTVYSTSTFESFKPLVFAKKINSDARYPYLDMFLFHSVFNFRNNHVLVRVGGFYVSRASPHIGPSPYDLQIEQQQTSAAHYLPKNLSSDKDRFSYH